MHKYYYLILINVKSYFLKLSNIVSLFVLPYVVFFLFRFNNNAEESGVSAIYNFISGTLVLISLMLGLNLFGKCISMDKTFKRIKLIKSNGISKKIHFISLFTPILFGVLMSIVVIVIFSYIVLEINIINKIIPLFFIIVLGTYSFTGFAYFIGFKSKDIISSNGFTNLLSVITISLSSLYYPLENIGSITLEKLINYQPVYGYKMLIYSILTDNPFSSKHLFSFFFLLLLSYFIYLITAWTDE